MLKMRWKWSTCEATPTPFHETIDHFGEPHMARNRGWPLGAKSDPSWQPARNWSLLSYDCKELNSANNLSELENRSFPRRASNETVALVNTFISTLWDPKQITQLNHTLTPDPQILLVNVLSWEVYGNIVTQKIIWIKENRKWRKNIVISCEGFWYSRGKINQVVHKGRCRMREGI